MFKKTQYKKTLLFTLASLCFAGNLNAGSNEIIVGDQYGGLYVWASNGDGTFETTPFHQSVNIFDQNGIGVGMFYGQELYGSGGLGTTLFDDLNNDGGLDFYMPSQEAAYPVSGQRDGFRSWLNNPGNGINGASILSGPISATKTIGTVDTDNQSFSADVTGDGNADYIQFDGWVSVYPGNGSGGFSPTWIESRLMRPTGELAGISSDSNSYLVDIDNDRVKDIVIAHVMESEFNGQPIIRGYLRAYEGAGNGTFELGSMFDVSLERPGGINTNNNDNHGVGAGSDRVSDFADIDGDGDLDYIHVSEASGTGQIWAYLNNGTATPFTAGSSDVPAVKTTVTSYPFGLLRNFAGHDDLSAGFFQDVDGRNGADYVSLTTNRGAAVYLSNGNGTFSPQPVQTAISGFIAGYSTQHITHMSDVGVGILPDSGIDGDRDGITDLIDPEPTVPANPPICTNPTPETDSDLDGITDACENSLVNPSGPTDDGDRDSDNDGLTDGEELIGRDSNGVPFYDTDGVLVTDPNIRDTDGDRLPDYVEVRYGGTDPTNNDTDGDGYYDRVDPWPVDPARP